MLMMTTMTMMKIALGDQKVDPAVYTKKEPFCSPFKVKDLHIFSGRFWDRHTKTEIEPKTVLSEEQEQSSNLTVNIWVGIHFLTLGSIL